MQSFVSSVPENISPTNNHGHFSPLPWPWPWSQQSSLWLDTLAYADERPARFSSSEDIAEPDMLLYCPHCNLDLGGSKSSFTLTLRLLVMLSHSQFSYKGLDAHRMPFGKSLRCSSFALHSNSVISLDTLAYTGDPLTCVWLQKDQPDSLSQVLFDGEKELPFAREITANYHTWRTMNTNAHFTLFWKFSVLLRAGGNSLGYRLPIFLSGFGSLSVKSARSLTRLVASLNAESATRNVKYVYQTNCCMNWMSKK